jgi:hypothetical protein
VNIMGLDLCVPLISFNIYSQVSSETVFSDLFVFFFCHLDNPNRVKRWNGSRH